jgi:anthranilate synthase component 1
MNMHLDFFDRLKDSNYNFVPFIHETLADLDTPLSLYLKLAQGPFSYLLESAEQGERFGRYSIIGLPAKTRIELHGSCVKLWKEDVCVESIEHTGNESPLDTIKQLMGVYRVPSKKWMSEQGFDPSVLPRFMGGWVGYAGHDVVQWIEPKLKGLDQKQKDPLQIPDAVFLLSEELVVVDNLRGKISWVIYADPHQPNVKALIAKRFETLLHALRQSVEIPEAKAGVSHSLKPMTDSETYKTSVKKIKEYILAGDCMQVVLSQRMSQPFTESPIALYRALRTLNPSPYMVYFDMKTYTLVGASPEILVRLETVDATTSRVVLRPIAGTKPRGKTLEEDLRLIEELHNDPKEVAEHVMLIDLGRNDVGRIAESGSVMVTERLAVEKYAHVIHLVSNVVGNVKAEIHPLDVLKATFPAGTLSGAPKVRAIEILYELEPYKRSWYGGAMGYIGFHGDMDLCIAIRTAVIKDQTLFVQAGAGIVNDSIPESEWQETLNKARSLERSAKMVAEGLDSVLLKS